MNSKKKIREFVLLEKSTPRKIGLKIFFNLENWYGQVRVFQNFQTYCILAKLLTCCVAALKCNPAHRYSVFIFTFSGPLGLQGPFFCLVIELRSIRG